MFVGFYVDDWVLGDIVVYGSLGNCWWNGMDQLGIEGYWDDVLGIEFWLVVVISSGDFVGDFFVCEFGQGLCVGNFYGVVDSGCVNVQCVLEDIGEIEYVVDLVGII